MGNQFFLYLSSVARPNPPAPPAAPAPTGGGRPLSPIGAAGPFQPTMLQNMSPDSRQATPTAPPVITFDLADNTIAIIFIHPVYLSRSGSVGLGYGRLAVRRIPHGKRMSSVTTAEP